MKRLLLALLFVGCGGPTEADLNSTRGGRVEAFFNEPGTRAQNMWEPDAVEVMIETIRDAKVSIDMAVMGFARDEVVNALLDAYDRGVQVRMVGDAGHLYNSGYVRFRDRHIPMVVGNLNHIMHNKFMIVDSRFVFGGTANWTDTDLRHNSNNFFLIDSPPVAADFQVEFNQLFGGLFGHSKVENDNGRFYQVEDTLVEVWFAPNEDAMGRILELVDSAKESVRFTIFAFTKDQLGSSLIRKQEEFTAKDLAEGISRDGDFRDHRSVAGVIDRSQLHSNGQYHEVYRLLGAHVPMRMDGNDNSQQPGDYQAGGGRLHSKTMVIDAEGEEPIVITGSFNWSSSATASNDEYLLIFHGKRVANEFNDYFERLWLGSNDMGVDFIEDDGLQPGDVVLNEIMWYGVTPQEPDGFDEYIELRNMTDRDITLDMWQIRKRDDFVLGLPPGSILPAGGLFTILDHTMEAYQDGVPQDEVSAFRNGDMIVNAFNDNRQARLYLVDGAMDLSLVDPRGIEMDGVGDGGPPPAGGPNAGKAYSMERADPPGDGRNPASWYDCTLEEGGVNVNDAYKAIMVGTPGEMNSPMP